MTSSLEAHPFTSLDSMRRRPREGTSRAGDVISEPLPLPKAPRPGLVVEGEWKVENHLCIRCLGRILGRVVTRPGVDGGDPETWRQFRCSNCGSSAETAGGRVSRHPPICCCAARYGSRDAGLRCEINPDRSTANPAEIIVRETG